MRYPFYGLPVCLIFLVMGCATQSEMGYLHEHIISLDNRVSRLENQVSKMGEETTQISKMIEETGRPATETQFNDRLDAIEADVERVNEQLEYVVTLENRDQLTNIENRIARLEIFLGFEAQRVTPTIEIPGETIEEVKAEDHEALYQDAYRLYQMGSFVEAREKFKEYLKLYPHTDESDNAQFWIGECFYSQKQYEEAVLEYEKVIVGYPNSNKICAALLKQGLALYELGDRTVSKLLLEKVIKEYPDTNEAKIAQRKLPQIR